ncbi:MAG: Serine/threonine-protein kinase PknA [Planctomycetes bacterium ADurb.Bin126]|nr:MAG: Serine/threonine-protein kinase PknA [Planctomycetes bacterium ADurb.Bin126]HOD79901.1 protein kinase [Phycisphaerae bacterium]HQL73284.1 protein kinase [Phycisphaerae bacterium]
MAYVEVVKDGKVVTRRELDEDRATEGCPIRLGPLGEVTLAVGQSVHLKGYDLTVFAGPLPPADAPPTSPPASTGDQASETPPGQSSESLPDAPGPEADKSQETAAAALAAAAQQQEAEQAAHAPAEPAGQPPEVEGYQILGPLEGQGGAWKAVQLSSQKIVALTVFPYSALADDSIRERFVKEIKLAARLEHPAIAGVYDTAVSRGKGCYVAEELIEGMPVDRYVLTHRLDRKQIAELMKKAALAVEAAHQKGLTHRALTPENILVTPDGQPHVIGFGLPRVTDQVSPLEQALASQTPASPTYLAPEQAAGRHDQVAEPSDVYSLGAILFRLLTAKYPHDMGGLQFEVYRRVIDQDALRLRRATSAADEDLDLILGKALARDIAQRYPSPAALAVDLDLYARTRPLTIRPRSKAYVARKFVQRNFWPVVISAAAVVILGIAAAIYLGVASKQADEDRVAQAEQKRLAAIQAERDRTNAIEIARIAEEERRREARRRGETIDETPATQPGPADKPDSPTTQVAEGPTAQPQTPATQPAPLDKPVPPAPGDDTAGLPAVVEWTPLFDGQNLGQWKPAAGQVVAEGGAIMLQAAPVTAAAYMGDFPNMHYEIMLETMRLNGSGTLCDLMLPVRSTCASVHLGGAGKGVGLRYTGPDGPDLAAAQLAVDDMKWYELRVRVSREQVVCYVNNAEVLKVSTADLLAKAPPNLPGAERLRLLTWKSTSAAFRNLRYRRLTVAEVAPPKPPEPATKPATRPATQPATKPAPKPTTKPATKPAPKPTTKPGPTKPDPKKPGPKKPATKPAPKPPEPPKPDPANPPPVKPEGEAKARFDEKFGEDMKKAVAWKDAIELARRLLEAAKALDYDPDLLTLLCEQAHTLAMKNPVGYPLAAEAMEFLADEPDQKRIEAMDKVIDVRKRVFGAARGLDKAQALEELLDAMVTLARAHLLQNDLAAASRVLGQAQGLAISGKAIGADEIKALLREVQLADQVDKQLKVLEARRKEKGDDDVIRRSLLLPMLLERDNPAEAEKLLYDKADEKLKKFIPLCAKPPAELSEEEARELMQFYREQSEQEKLSYLARRTLLRRRVLLARAYLAGHKDDQTARKDMQMVMDQCEKDLSRMGDVELGLGLWRDLTPLVNLKADVAGGKWAFNGCSLTLEGAAPNAMVSLPEKLLGSYQAMVRLVPGEQGDCLIDLPVGSGRALTVIVSGDKGGLGKVGGKVLGASVKDYESGKACTVKANVTVGAKVEVVVHVNGLAYAKWSGQAKDASPVAPDKAHPQGMPVIRVGCRSGTARFQAVRVRMLGGQTQPLRPRLAPKGPLD